MFMTGATTYKEFKVPGKIISIVQGTTSPHRINGLSTPYDTPCRTLFVLTIHGIAVLIKPRPIDILYRLLNSANRDAAIHLLDYRSSFNGVSLCLDLISSPSSIASTGVNSVEPVTDLITSRVKVLLKSKDQTTSDL
ncbi:hypothetical protein BDF21DRAFT_82076 [Thamnidium elegans]|uniref:Uncharacterized protein n=1 Tax=Thamnidium elegans TaxID=101142 RepID=A0A8H7SYF3_9FUNG|nr:hypothetical protein INT48_005548 [Thamnidium elegans]KAI8071985.1 hypothetical protein BDF21DRAFT_82076 [Thamnidium elegans]